MPVTRSSSRQTSQKPSSQLYTSRRADPSGSGGSKKASKSPSNEIIVLSSDDDEPPPKGTLVLKKSPGRTSKRKVVPPVHTRDVLEISSDDESMPKKSSTRKQAQSAEATNRDLERTIKKLQEELKSTEQLLATSSREIEELKCDFYNKDASPLLSFFPPFVFAGLEEHTLCEVCTLTMWCPYILPECGHSFCEKCLVDWFSTTQARHMTANPQLDDSRSALAGQLHAFVQMVPNLHAYGLHGQQHVRAVLAGLRRHRPDYTCPSCRKEVLNKPVEGFRLKDLINQIAGLMGETEPHKDTLAHRGSGSGPFDHFFAAPAMHG
ncbi:hypothetical protein L210DRAFT_896447 [Boletus edulis BED1]|uniref:RING-type domain-containing protein n=1 Tax=Boletus edulis BED1 TaxID=1328754 RepID=A0AAD4BWE8_BOLED|nr:hypothetical protein L210DRAFT_896447 [Boletus edulis BED1]